MKTLRAMIIRLRSMFRSDRREQEFSAEIESHVAMHTEDGMRAGLSQQDAHRRALIELGGVEQTRQSLRERNTLPWSEDLLRDIRYAMRQLRASPGFAATVVVTLALGIGANLAIFQLLYGVVFAHLPIAHPEELHSLHAAPSPFDGEWFYSFPAYQRLRNATRNQSPVLARSGVGVAVLQQPGEGASRIVFQLVSDNFFPVLGLSPVSGRFFAQDEDERLQNEWPVILRYGFFARAFGGDRSVIGKRLTLNGIPIVIVGVAPEGFNGVMQGTAPDVWLPLAAQTTGRFGTWFDSMGPGFNVNLDTSYLHQPQVFWLWVLARTPGALQPNLSAQWTAAIAPDLALLASGQKDPQRRAQILTTQMKLISAAHGEGSLQKRYGLPLTILMAMAGTVLLVGCLNLANLQLARLLQRQREFAIRMALGASRSRVLQQVAIETVMLAVMGGALAWVTGRACSTLLLHWASNRGASIPINLQIGVPGMLLGAALLVAAMAGFGLVPAWRITRRSPSETSTLRSSRQAGTSRAGGRWSGALLAAQVSLSLLLLCSAALFAQTLNNLNHIDAGMDSEHILSVHLDMRSTGFAAQQHDLAGFYNGLLARLKALPSVRDAAVQMCEIPDCGWNTAFYVNGNSNLAQTLAHGEENHIGMGYFRTLGIPLLRGRDFTSADTAKTTRVAILSQSYARRLFGDRDPIGHWIGYSPRSDREEQVVGVVADAQFDGLRSDAPPVAYLSLEQSPQPVQTIEVRARGSMKTLAADLRAVLHAYAPDLPVTDIVPLNVELADGLMTEKLLARLTAVFGALTLAMAAIGFYGLLSSRVTRRTAEIGIRMALGADRGQVQLLFLKQTLAILLVGVIPGAVLAIGLQSTMRKLLYGAGHMEFWALGFSIGVLAGVGLLATLLPARRAAATNPMGSLRAE